MKKLAILGSTGSIGQSTLSLCESYPDRFHPIALAAGSNLDTAFAQCQRWRPKLISISTEPLADELSQRLRAANITGIEVVHGTAGTVRVATLPAADFVVSAIVGVAGLEATYAAVLSGKTVGLANKECLVAAGNLILDAAREHNAIVTVPAAKTIADGIAVRTAGTLTFPLVQKYVDDIVTVDEEEIASAILLLLEKEKTLTEGAGAAATAAALHKKIPHRGKKLGILICGGNIDVTLLSRIIERGLVKDGRLVRLRIHLPDHPGALVRLSTVIAEQKANIIQTSHDRAYYGAVLGDTVIDVTMETRGPDHIADLAAALEAANYLSERVQ